VDQWHAHLTTCVQVAIHFRYRHHRMASISVLRGGDRGYTRPTQRGENQDCLRRLTPPRPPAQVKANLPVKHLIGWLYYGAAFQWGNKRAVRTGRTTRIDFMWRYSLIM
jgi:hypothetical protein